MPKSAASRPSRRPVCITFSVLALVSLLAVGLTAQKADTSPELFSSVMQRVSAQPEFRERLLQGIRDLPKVGEFLSPDLVDRLRVLILGKEWQRVDHFPALTVAALNTSVGAAVKLAGSSTKPLQPAELLDTAEYPLGQAEAIDLDHPATAPTYADDPATARREIGFNLTMGDGPDPALAPMHAQSRQLAAVLNRLAMNASANDPGEPPAVATLDGKHFTDGSALIHELAESGHRVSITDDVYFANFGHLHDGGREVMMPFWIDTQIAVPASRRSLLLPVSHSEQELHLRGPKWNADVSFYFGIDGKAEFRTMDSLNQSWVMHRVLFSYADAGRQSRVLQLLSSAVRVYYQARISHPELPFGGYYRLGVCQDVSATVESELQGKTILFPLTHDPAYFPQSASADPRDREFLTAFAAIPSDRRSGLPPIDRLLGALPTLHYNDIAIPGLANDLERVEVARRLGLLQRTHP
ncbi:MAG TPA: hypothetical protein VE218_11880, partial [Acidobacteriaceae bacterium]|nr:hypothetical protein [Acidobacteriaceae bacterium]